MALPPNTLAHSSGERGGNASSSALLTAPYDPASRQTGQSEPYITRSVPKTSTARLTYGLRSEGVQSAQLASVIMPESLQETCESERNGSSSALQASISPEAIGGLAMWSMTNRASGSAFTFASAAGSSRGRTRMS